MHRLRLTIVFAVLTTFAVGVHAADKCNKGEYCVYRETSSHKCRVQEPTESHVSGDSLLGPFKTQKEATQAMCKALDFGNMDEAKCADVTPANACEKAPQDKSK